MCGPTHVAVATAADHDATTPAVSTCSIPLAVPTVGLPPGTPTSGDGQRAGRKKEGGPIASEDVQQLPCSGLRWKSSKKNSMKQVNESTG